MAVPMAVSAKGALMSANNRQDYGDGSLYQRCDKAKGCPPMERDADGKRYRPEHKCKGPWIGSLDVGWTERGVRKRVTVQARTEPKAKKRLRDLRLEYEATGEVADDRMTVKQWGDTYLALRLEEVRPNSYTAIRSAVRKWIVPTIGKKRLGDLKPSDIRAIEDAMYAAGSKTGHVHNVRSKLTGMLKRAEAEGHKVPPRVYTVKLPGRATSDRMPLTIEDTVKCLLEASNLEHGVRWLLALVYATRLEETLGLTEDALDFENKVIRLEWQLQRLPYADPKDRSKGFRTPRDYEYKQLHLAYHLVRPKTDEGRRDLPMHPLVEQALLRWLPQRPESKCANGIRLVFPDSRGLPKYHEDDRQEWWDLQKAAGVEHPGGKRFYHIHECRNFAATQIGETGASDIVITSLVGHTDIKTTRGYQVARADAQSAALGAVLGELRAAGWRNGPEESVQG